MAESGRWKIAMLVCIAAMVVLAISELRIPGFTADLPQPAKVGFNTSPGSSPLTISVHAPVDHLIEGHSVPVEILFTNSGTSEIRLEESWMAECFQLTGASQRELIAVGKMSSRIERLQLTPLCWHGAYPIAFYFRPVSGEPPYESVASIAPLQLTTDALYWTYRLFFLVAAFLKTLAIPGALAWLAFWFQRKSASRDEQKKTEEEAQSRREGILAIRLPEYVKLVQEHYLSISRRGDTIESEMPPLLQPVRWVEPGSQEEAELIERAKTQFGGLTSHTANELWRLLCAVLLYRARLLALISSKGGIYFRSNQAERLFAQLLSGFFWEIYTRLGIEDFSEAVAVFDADERLSSALRRCISGVAAREAGGQEETTVVERAVARRKAREEERANMLRFQKIFTAFQQWILTDPVGFRAHTRLIQLASRILDFECDRPFYQTAPWKPGLKDSVFDTGWYFDPPLLNFSAEMFEIPKSLRAGLFPEIQYYIDYVPENCKRLQFPTLPQEKTLRPIQP